MGDIEQLRELHDTYVWQVNAAIGEDRLDLVNELADEYLDQALELITGGEPHGCGRPDCAVCHRTRPVVTRPRRRGWLRHRRRTDVR